MADTDSITYGLCKKYLNFYAYFLCHGLQLWELIIGFRSVLLT